MVVRAAFNLSDHQAFNRRSDVGVADFIALGIDDLAKYRIVQLLCAKPDVCIPADVLAERLGLRPLERTKQELDELADKNLLERQGNDIDAKYKLTTDGSKQVVLSLLFAVAKTPQFSGNILARLASRSVQRVKAKCKAKRKASSGDSQTNG